MTYAMTNTSATDEIAMNTVKRMFERSVSLATSWP